MQHQMNVFLFHSLPIATPLITVSNLIWQWLVNGQLNNYNIHSTKDHANVTDLLEEMNLMQIENTFF